MTQSLEERIDAQEQWSFRECLGLAAEFDVKTRMVVVLVLARGKHYVEQASDKNQVK
jgi:hypothetical protein